MRSFHQIPVALCALIACALADYPQDSNVKYDATIYVTSTITRINTVTATVLPTGAPANSTSIIPATHPAMPTPFPSGNSTAVAPTGTVPVPTGARPTATKPPNFPGAASSLNLNPYLAALAAGVAYLVL